MKTKITKNSKIALLALILFSPVFFSPVLFSLVGGNNLQAQEQKSSKTTGWFVGVNPFSPSIELETKHSGSYTNFTRITETISGDIETRREVTVDSNITSTSAADLRVEYEIQVIQFNNNLYSTQQKIDSIEAGRYACREDISFFGARFGGNYFSFQVGDNENTSNENIFCGLPSDATAIAEIAKLGATQSFNYISDSFASGGITTSSDEQFTPTPANGVSSGASSKTKLKGSNLHFGYAFENFRLTFSDFSWSSTSGNVRSSVLFADWLLPRGFYAGAGIAANSLKHNGASDKALKPVFTFGKKKKFSSRLSINLGVIYQQVELSTSNITSNSITSSNTETGLAEALANSSTTETTTTSSNEAVALVTSWLEQHPDSKKDFLIVDDDRYANQHNVIPYRLVYAPGTSTTTTKTTTTNNGVVIERTTEIETMQEIQTESKVTIPPLFFINISINF